MVPRLPSSLVSRFFLRLTSYTSRALRLVHRYTPIGVCTYVPLEYDGYVVGICTQTYLCVVLHVEGATMDTAPSASWR